MTSRYYSTTDDLTLHIGTRDGTQSFEFNCPNAAICITYRVPTAALVQLHIRPVDIDVLYCTVEQPAIFTEVDGGETDLIIRAGEINEWIAPSTWGRWQTAIATELTQTPIDAR